MIGWVVTTLLLFVVVMTFVPSGVRRQSLPGEMRILRIFIAARLVMPQVMNYVGRNADTFFTGGWDADEYHTVAVKVMRDLMSTGRSMSHREVPGTGAVDLSAGWLYFFFRGSNRMAVAYVATGFASVGIVMFWAATRDLVKVRRERYAAFILLTPTTMFWSSSLSKEAPILFGIGALALGLRYLLSGRQLPKALAYGVCGLIATLYVRPHVTLAFFAGATVAALVARSSRTVGDRSSTRFGLLMLAALGLGVAFVQSGALLGAEGTGSVIDAAYKRAESTAEGQGRSAYAQDPVRSPAQVPGAITTVLLRPFPWEIRTFAQFLTTAEALALMGILFVSVKDHLTRKRRFEPNVFVLTSVVFVLILSTAISTYGNFGLIARQRLQLWPFLTFVAFAPQVVRRDRTESRLPVFESDLVR